MLPRTAPLTLRRLMESTLHRQLKGLYGGSEEDCEVLVEGYRIDAVARGRLIEIQRASLSAIRSKIAELLQGHRVTLVKPLAARTLIVRRDEAGGPIVSQRYSPLRRTTYHLFEELVHFGGVFPHPKLTLEVLMIEQAEHRVTLPKRRFNGPGFRVEDRQLLQIVSRQSFQTARDFFSLLPESLPTPFQTQDLAREAGIPRWLAQKMVYCLKQSGPIAPVGKLGNAVLYCSQLRPRRKRGQPSRGSFDVEISTC